LIAPADNAVINAPAGIPVQIFRWRPPTASVRIDFYRFTLEDAGDPAAAPARSEDIVATGAQMQTSQILAPALRPGEGFIRRIRWSVRACNNERSLQQAGEEAGNCSEPVSRILVWRRDALPQSGGPPPRPKVDQPQWRQFVIAAAASSGLIAGEPTIGHGRTASRISEAASIVVHRSTDRTTWSASTLFRGSNATPDTGYGPPSCTSVHPRPGSSPGIGSNGRYYVLAFWGIEQSAQASLEVAEMYIATSKDGQLWTNPYRVHTTSAIWSEGGGIHPKLGRFFVVPSAGISVAPLGLNGPWFAAYADASGAIHVILLPVRPADGAVDPESAQRVPVLRCLGVEQELPVATIAGATTDAAPTLSHWGSRLVLAWRTPQDQIRRLTSTDGLTWAHARASGVLTDRASGAALITASAPFLNYGTGPTVQSGASLYLTLTRWYASPGTRTGDGGLFHGRLHVLASADGASFTQIREYRVADASVFGSAIAGHPGGTTFVATYPEFASAGSGTTLFRSWLAEQTLQTETPYRASIAMGP
jgi:hypothetical protein